MRPLIEIIETDGEPNTIEEILLKEQSTNASTLGEIDISDNA